MITTGHPPWPFKAEYIGVVHCRGDLHSLAAPVLARLWWSKWWLGCWCLLFCSKIKIILMILFAPVFARWSRWWIRCWCLLVCSKIKMILMIVNGDGTGISLGRSPFYVRSWWIISWGFWGLIIVEAGLHKLWYPGIRDTSTWSKFRAHGEHGDVFLFSNLGALWFSENLIRYSLHFCLREVKKKSFFPQTLLFTAFLVTVLKILTYALVSTWSSAVSSGWEHVKRKMHPCCQLFFPHTRPRRAPHTFLRMSSSKIWSRLYGRLHYFSHYDGGTIFHMDEIFVLKTISGEKKGFCEPTVPSPSSPEA